LKNLLKFLSVFAYTILIFFFDGVQLAPFAAINIVIMIFTKVTPYSAFKYIVSLSPFIVFACIFNFILGDPKGAVNLALRLLLIANISQCYKKVLRTQDLADAIETMFSPLKCFKVDARDAGLMVCISLAFLPVLRRDFAAIRLALRAKGMRLTAWNFKYILGPFFTGIFRRANEISRALRTKGYE
jgi:energy-coupling factor transporter transmembrane protein EcfT